MSRFLQVTRLPAIISTILVLPFVVLEVINRKEYGEGFPVVLFVFLWLLPAGFVLILKPFVKALRADGPDRWRYAWLILSLTLLALITWVWASIVLDQIPCFLGVPNCD